RPMAGKNNGVLRKDELEMPLGMSHIEAYSRDGAILAGGNQR
ncbi:hypothetical protein A2U01_0115075, partial [Trifolium medium]|nr:hypothetical protein [Trifolium medium]